MQNNIWVIFPNANMQQMIDLNFIFISFWPWSLAFNPQGKSSFFLENNESSSLSKATMHSKYLFHVHPIVGRMLLPVIVYLEFIIPVFFIYEEFKAQRSFRVSHRLLILLSGVDQNQE